MALTSGTYRLGPGDGDLLVQTSREGAASLLGHDLTLVATRWSATVTVDVRVVARSRVKATIHAGSLQVREASGGAIGLTDSQKAEVERNIREKVLHSDRHPRITFASTSVTGDARKASVTGNLTITGKTRPVTLNVRVDGRSTSPRIHGTASIAQTDFGIRPYTALLGALRVRDVVDIRVAVTPPSP
jgi:polyisoprenoid-binding protein YceI